MYSRSEAAHLKQEFWIAFGRYLSLNLNSEGLKTNWVNYHTGHKNVYFRMDAGKDKAAVYILLNHPDELTRELYFDKFRSFRSIITDSLQEEWIWEQDATDEYGKNISLIGIEIKGVSIYDKNTWPEIISFLKIRIIALDEIWNNIKDAFEDLR